ncbi:hypothetical protein CRG98_049813, partial [Punica granatum]
MGTPSARPQTRPPAPKFPQLRLSLPPFALTLSLAETRSSFFLLLPHPREPQLDLSPETRSSRPAFSFLPDTRPPESSPFALDSPLNANRVDFFFWPQPGLTAQKPSPWSAAARSTSSSPAAAIKQRPSQPPRPYSVQQACSAQSSPVHPHRILARHGPAQLIQHFNFLIFFIYRIAPQLPKL